MPLSICEPYVWYLVVTCKNCGLRQPIHRDKSDGKATLLRRYTWRCIQCHHNTTYEPDEIERYQHLSAQRKSGTGS
jgi:predicted nucleic-acid-binding Zn-ribbon protein